MKIVLIVLAVIVAVYLYLDTRYSGRRRRPDAGRSLPEVSAVHPVAGALEAQCAAQARKTFAALGYTESALTFFANHYNHTLGKCFLEIVTNSEGRDSSDERQVTHHELLLDAYEQTAWGEYLKSTGRRQQPLTACTITQPGLPRMTCYSNDEFADLLRTFME
jgi:hypothetical protein